MMNDQQSGQNLENSASMIATLETVFVANQKNYRKGEEWAKF